MDPGHFSVKSDIVGHLGTSDIFLFATSSEDKNDKTRHIIGKIVLDIS